MQDEMFPETIDELREQLVKTSIELEKLQCEYEATKQGYRDLINPLEKRRLDLVRAIGKYAKDGAE